MTSNKMNSLSQLEALTKLADHIVYSDSKEYRDYTEWCQDNDLDPKDIQGEMQSTHIYAMALIGLDSEFSEE